MKKKRREDYMFYFTYKWMWPTSSKIFFWLQVFVSAYICFGAVYMIFTNKSAFFSEDVMHWQFLIFLIALIFAIIGVAVGIVLAYFITFVFDALFDFFTRPYDYAEKIKHSNPQYRDLDILDFLEGYRQGKYK